MRFLAGTLCCCTLLFGLSGCASGAPKGNPTQTLSNLTDWGSGVPLLSRAPSIQFGSRDQEALSPADEIDFFGLEYSTSPAGSIGWEAGFQLGNDSEKNQDSGLDLDSSTSEFYTGLRMTLNQNSYLRPYVGAGLSMLSLTHSGALGTGVPRNEDESALGLYAHAGINWFLTGSFALGLDYREWFGEDSDEFGEFELSQLGYTISFGF